MNVIVNSLAVNYQQTGHGKTILMLHGWGDSLVTFDAMASLLSTSYEIVRLDLPGFGGTQSPSGGWSLNNYAEFVKEYIEKTGIKPYAVIGHSNGGAIAVKGITSNQFSPDKLVLIASAGIRNKSSLKKQFMKTSAKGGKIFTSLLPSSTQVKLRKKLYGTLGSDLLVAPHMEETFKKITSEDIQDICRNVKIDTLIITGDKDTATPLEYAKTFHKLINGSELFVLEGTTHFVHQEEPAKVVERINGFLK